MTEAKTTKLEQCNTCKRKVHCYSVFTCAGCHMYSAIPLNAASHIPGTVTCRCLTVERDETCRYYKKLEEGTTNDI